MRPLAAVLVLVSLTAAGCGRSPVMAPVSMTGPAILASQTAKLDTASVEKGKADGLAKAAGKTRSNLAAPTGVDPNGYAYGYAVGLLTGTLNTFNRIEGNFDVREWKNFAYNLRSGMTEAMQALDKNPQMANKYGATIGILQGGIEAFDSINGSFDVYQWKSFAYSNKAVLERALRSLNAPVPQGPQGPQG